MNFFCFSCMTNHIIYFKNIKSNKNDREYTLFKIFLLIINYHIYFNQNRQRCPLIKKKKKKYLSLII